MGNNFAKFQAMGNAREKRLRPSVISLGKLWENNTHSFSTHMVC